MRLAIVTNFPSYHNVDLFNELAHQSEIDIKVFYLRELTPGRHWKNLRTIKHPHEFVKEVTLTPQIYLNPGLLSKTKHFDPNILLITQYASIGMQMLMYVWSITGKPWIYWSEAPGVKFTEHLIIENDAMRHIMRKMALFPLRNGPKQIWAIGNYSRQIYQSYSRANCVNVPYYFKQDAFLNIAERNHLYSENNPVKFVFSGKQVYRKGFDILLEASRILDLLSLPFHIYVMGDFPDDATLASMNSSIQDRITFLGFRELDEVPQIYAMGDVLLFPSRYDGWGMAVVEAMAAGMPVISSSATVSAQDSITDGHNGFIFESENSQALATHMQYFIEHPHQIKIMGKNARESARQYSAHFGARRFVNLLQKLLTSHST